MATEDVPKAANLPLHDEAFWHQEMGDIVQVWESFDGPLTQMDQRELARFVGFVWHVVVRDHAILEQFATEQPPEQPVAPPKPRKRLRAIRPEPEPEPDDAA